MGGAWMARFALAGARSNRQEDVAVARYERRGPETRRPDAMRDPEAPGPGEAPGQDETAVEEAVCPASPKATITKPFRLRTVARGEAIAAKLHESEVQRMREEEAARVFKALPLRPRRAFSPKRSTRVPTRPSFELSSAGRHRAAVAARMSEAEAAARELRAQASSFRARRMPRFRDPPEPALFSPTRQRQAMVAGQAA